MLFKIIKKAPNSFWHLYNNGSKEVNLSDFEVVLDSMAQTFNIQCLNGANIPNQSVQVANIRVIDQTAGSFEETFPNVSTLKDRLTTLGYTPYKSTTGIEEAPVDGNTYGRKNEGWNIITQGVSQLVALPFTTEHLTATGNQYAVGDIVYYIGNVYRCIAANDSILPTNISYWTNLGAGYPLVQQPSDWNATSGNNQILNKPTIANTPTLQEVLDNNHNLVDNNFFAGTDAGNANSSTSVIAIGNAAAQGNSANSVNALGDSAGFNNSGDFVNALGPGAAYINFGNSVNAFGSNAATGNDGNNVNAFGNNAGDENTFNNVNLFGENATADEDGQTVLSKDGTIMARISTTDLTATRKYNLPDADGTLALTTDLNTPTLQQVTDEGNTITTANSIITLGDDNVSVVDVNLPEFGASIGSLGFLANGDTSQTSYQYNKIYYADEITTKNLQINYPASIVSTNKVQTFQDADGTIALLSDIGVTSTLQQVTDEGNETTQIIKVKDSEKSVALQTNGINYEDIDDGGNTLLRFEQTSLVDQEVLVRGLGGTMALLSDIPAAGVTSVGLTMPSAFTVTNSPITSSGDIAVSGAGLVSQYVRGDGTLANFPASTGGGASLSFYLNGSVSQGTIGGVAFREMDRTPILGAGTDFTINANGYIQSFITDAGVPNLLEIPAGNWNFETYFSASSGGGSPSFYVELYKWNGTTLSLIASNSAIPEGITNGTSIDAYFSALAVPQTTLLATDRLAIRIYVNHSSKTITLHTENSHLCQVITTFSTGITALNGLTAQVQNFSVGTGATNFNISSSSNTHTFNLLFNIRRNANNSSNNNINYNGYAVTGSAESSAVWTIKRLTIAASGAITVGTATNVAWTNRESATYI